LVIRGTVLGVVATSIEHGPDANKAAVPDVGDVYQADDTERLYVCFSYGLWTDLFAEIRLLPKAFSSGPEGTVFYDSVDKCIYVGVET